MTYAQILNGFVKNIIIVNDVELLPYFSDGYDAVVDITEINPRPQIGWSYLEGVFDNPSFSLNMIKAQKISEFKEAIFAYRDSKYDSNARESFQMIYLLARLDGLTNRAAYLEPLINWRLAVISYGVSFAQQVNAMSTAEEVYASTWNFDENIPINPSSITLLGALSIED